MSEKPVDDKSTVFFLPEPMLIQMSRYMVSQGYSELIYKST